MTNKTKSNIIYFAISSNDDGLYNLLKSSGYDMLVHNEHMTDFFKFDEPSQLLNLPNEDDLFDGLCEFLDDPTTDRNKAPFLKLTSNKTKETINVTPWLKGHTVDDFVDSDWSEPYLLFTVNKDTLEVADA